VAIKKLIEKINVTNIAEELSKTQEGKLKLKDIGEEVLSGWGADWDSMSEWRANIQEGLDLIEPETKEKSQPWQGASNFKTPILMEARLKFGDRASEELLGTDDLVKGKIFGEDLDNKKEKRVERVCATMNYQLTVEEEDWLDDMDKMLYNLACQGTMFKKPYFDPIEGHNVSEIIQFPDFAINQAASSYSKAPRFTHRIFKTPAQVQTLFNANVWIDCRLDFGARTGEDEGEDEVVLHETQNEKNTEFYEQQTMIDLDGDEIEEPYIVTVQATTGKVVRIVAQWALDGIKVMKDTGEVFTMDELIKKDDDGQPIIKEGQIQFDYENCVLLKIDRDRNIVPFEFLTNPKGELLSVGYFHVLGSYAQSINANTNRLQDAGTLANMQGGFMARGFRKRMGVTKMKPGVYHETNLSATELQNGIREYSFKEPSPTLHALLKDMQADAQRLGATADLGAAVGPNTPAATVLSIVHEQQQSVGAIILRVYRSLTKEYRLRYRLNGKFMDPKQYKRLMDNQDADAMADFNTADMDILPAANPKNNSMIQRIQRSNAEMGAIDQVVSTGGNPQPLVKGFLTAIGSDHVDEVYPTLSPEEQEAAKAEEERLKQLEEQLRFLPVKAQADLGEAEKRKAVVAEQKVQIEGAKAQTEMLVNQQKAENLAADTQKKLAETEDIQLDTDMTQSGVMDVLESGIAGLQGMADGET